MTDEQARIAKVIASRGYCSRRQAESLITKQKVKLNGNIVASPALNCSLDADIEIDGEILDARERVRLWLYHKPRGLITSHKDEKGRKTVFDEIKNLGLPRVISVGRLDYNSEGLLLLTNSGELADQLMRPNLATEREYLVRAYLSTNKKNPPLANIKNTNFTISGERFNLKSCVIEKFSNSNIWYRVILCEGKNREIRKIFEHHNMQVNRLIRVRYGKYNLANLEPGKVKEVKI